MSHAYLMVGEYEKAIETDEDMPTFVGALALDLMGSPAESASRLRAQMSAGLPLLLRLFLDCTIELLENRRQPALEIADRILAMWQHRDPCGKYYLSRVLSRLEHPRAMEIFKGAVLGGFHCSAFYMRDPWLDPLRGEPAFREILDYAEAQRRDAAEAFISAGGERILGSIGSD